MTPRRQRSITPAVALCAMLLVLATPTSADPNALAAAPAPRADYAAALAQIAPSVVRIDTVGGAQPARERQTRTGAERVRPAFLRADGPATGVIWSADGDIITSSFNFVSDPSVIVVRLADGRQLVADRVATDHVTRLTLLKVDARDLPTPTRVPRAELAVGLRTLTAGFGHGSDAPTLTTGILSALSRMSGLALQTDAGTSPANYGGPLFDLAGRLIGIIVPLGPGNDELAGVQWYDSGIGFAIDAELVADRVDRLRNGQDLQRGYLGISVDGRHPVTAPLALPTTQPTTAPTAAPGLPLIADPHGPAADAGLRKGDILIAIDDTPTPSLLALQRTLARRAAGDKVRLTYVRDGVSREAVLTLASAADFAQRDLIMPADPNAPATDPNAPRDPNAHPFGLPHGMP